MCVCVYTHTDRPGADMYTYIHTHTHTHDLSFQATVAAKRLSAVRAQVQSIEG